MNNRSPLQSNYLDNLSNPLYMLNWMGEGRIFEGQDEGGFPNYEITPIAYLERSHWKDWGIKFDPFEICNLSPAMKMDGGDKHSDSIKLCSPHPF